MPTRSQVLGYLQDIREATPEDPVNNIQIADYLEALINHITADGEWDPVAQMAVAAAKANKSGDTFTGTVIAPKYTASAASGGLAEMQLLQLGNSNWGIRAVPNSADLGFWDYSAGAYRMRITGNGYLVLGGSDNGLARLQTPTLSLGVDTWQFSSDGVSRLFYSSSGLTYHRVPLAGGHYFRFDTVETYRMTKEVFGQYGDSFNDITQAMYSAPLGAASRSFTHRKETDGVSYRFFDWDGSTARDWWNVYSNTQKMIVGQIINLNYGSNVGLGTFNPDSSALLDLTSTTKGLLLPRMTTTERNAIPVSAARKGLVIMNTTTNKINVYNGSAWEAVTSA